MGVQASALQMSVIVLLKTLHEEGEEKNSIFRYITRT
jgi:hypothetical protein